MQSIQNENWKIQQELEEVKRARDEAVYKVSDLAEEEGGVLMLRREGNRKSPTNPAGRPMELDSGATGLRRPLGPSEGCPCTSTEYRRAQDGQRSEEGGWT